jgi:hypothetical protein
MTEPRKATSRNRVVPFALVAAGLTACSGPSSNDFFGSEPPGASGTGGNVAGMSGAAGSSGGSAGTPANGGSAGKGGTAGSSMAGNGGSAGTETTAGTAGSSLGGTAGSEATGGTAGTETAGTAGTEAGAGAGGSAGSTAGVGGTDAAGTGGMSEAGAGGATPCVPEDERCDGLDNDCENGIDDGNACPSGCTGGNFEGHDYLFCVAPNSGLMNGRTWSAARTYCIGRDMLLVHLETEAEANFVYAGLTALDEEEHAWMGATDRSGEDNWVWEGATTLDVKPFYDAEEGMAIDGAFIDWREGEPNDDGSEDCGVIENQSDGTWLWDDRACTQSLVLLVCEGTP